MKNQETVSSADNQQAHTQKPVGEPSECVGEGMKGRVHVLHSGRPLLSEKVKKFPIGKACFSAVYIFSNAFWILLIIGAVTSIVPPIGAFFLILSLTSLCLGALALIVWPILIWAWPRIVADLQKKERSEA